MGAWLKAWRASCQEDRAELVLPGTSCVGFAVASSDDCIVCQMGEMELSGSPGFQDFCKDHVATRCLKLISCNSASNELKRGCSIQNRGGTSSRGGHHVAFAGLRSCWFPLLVLQQGRLSTWPPDESSSIRHSFGRRQSTPLTIFSPFQLSECFLGSFRAELPP